MSATVSSFQVNARLILELGDELIRNSTVALLELVKNSYDADSSKVKISFSDLDKPLISQIIIEDDGEGMDLKTIEDAWLVIGTDYKKKKYNNKTLTTKFKRLPIGEKGIGRFGAHKLGDKLEIISKRDSEKEIFVSIDWNRFQTAERLSDVVIDIIEREPVEFISHSGTKLVINSLRNNWDEQEFKDAYQALISLHSPFKNKDSFSVEIESNVEDWLNDITSWNDIEGYALFKVKAELSGNEIKHFNYEFKPWESMDSITGRIVNETSDEIKKAKFLVTSDNQQIDLEKEAVGKVVFEALIFDRDSKLLKLSLQNKESLKNYLDKNGGIRVYRDGIRVYDYGEPGNDWLKLDMRRVNMPSKRISNNIILGAVYIDREESTGLIEKTNREGFVENKAYKVFRDSISYLIHKTELLREPDKEKLRSLSSPSPKSEPVLSDIHELSTIIEKKIIDPDLKKEINTYISRIETEYKEINEILLKSAGAGLSLSVVIHEVEKILSELKSVLKKEKVPTRIVSLVKHLSDLVEGYSILVRNSDKKKFSVASLIKQALFNMEFRLKTHNVKIIEDVSNKAGNTTVPIARNMVLGVLMNIIDNSIWWLEYSKVQEKKIYLSVLEDNNDYITLIIVDNASGFSLPTEEIIKPFVSGKPDGMGLGLHIASEIMKAHNGELIFPSNVDINIPEDFRSGALIGLKLRKT